MNWKNPVAIYGLSAFSAFLASVVCLALGQWSAALEATAIGIVLAVIAVRKNKRTDTTTSRPRAS
jgi:hypothetical protein